MGKEAIQRLAEGAVQADLARSYGVSQATISRLAAPSPFEPRLAGA
jgi:predicted transcriptional regulator